jgi:hypothetical protein
MSQPVRGGAAAICAKLAYDVPVLAVVIRRDERRCRTMSTRRGALCSVDHRPRCPCTVAPPSCAPRLPTMYQYSLLLFSGTSADVGQCRLVEACCAVSTVDLAACARWRRRRVRQGCLRCISTCCGGMADRAQMSDNVDSSRRAVDYRPSTSLPVHDGAAVVCAKVAHDVPVLVVVEWLTARRCLTMSTRSGARCSVDHRRARWRRCRVRQGCLRCTSTRCRNSAGRAQMSHNVDSSRRAVQCGPSTSPPVHGGTAVACAKVAYDVPVHRCRHSAGRAQMSHNVDSSRRVVQCRPSTSPPVHGGAAVVCAPRLPMMYPYLLWWNDGPRADVGQCRLVLARGEVSTIDLAARARWRRCRVRQGCLRCTSTRCRNSAGRAQMSHNVDSSRSVVQCRPSTSPPVRGGAAVVCAMVAYDVTVLAVVEWRSARRCWSMSTRSGARRSVDHRPRRPCTVACAKVAYGVPVLAVVVWWDARRCRAMSFRFGARRSVDHRSRGPCTVARQLCAPTLPTMYQYLLLSFGGTSADVGQCRLVLARSAVSIISLAAGVRRCHGTIEMHDYTYGCIK